MLFANPNREVSEWLKELAWKASIWVTVSWVRIPSSLQKKAQIQLIEIALFYFSYKFKGHLLPF
jgi:hypothetical protein